ncbi:MAG: alpha-glucosidase/alpha-galactosidase [Lentisphaerae bacterium]|jgi:alpha-galactosidase|nr:alpha-glucosidase/alpha-galactosidase [Lentisphaerota bacterium]
MTKITFMGAGSTVFAKNILGDSMLTDCLKDSTIALYDINAERLHESHMMLENLNNNINGGRAKITTHLNVKQRRAALKDADFVINAIQVGGYEPSTVADFEIPKKYGLRQTIGDTLGIGGIFRALRTIPVMEGFANDMKAVCPNAWFLNYTNPMSILTGFLIRKCDIKAVGLCHSVQVCAEHLLRSLNLWDKYNPVTWKVAGINHMAWLLDISKDGKSIYPEVRKAAERINRGARKKDGEKHGDMVRFEMMKHFGYYNTESSEHTAEYHPYFIKKQYPELIEEFNIPLDEYPRRCQNQIAGWLRQREEIVNNKKLTHNRTHEYGSYIMESILTDKAIEIGGNVINNGLISNLPADACVEVPCLVNRNGVQGCAVGELPPQCAALNMTHINVHTLTIEAAMARSRSLVYQAAMLDPHTRSELTLDEIRAMCDELFEAHVKDGMMPEYK